TNVTVGTAADVDLIQSLSFAPDGQRLASGGFRTVKIWRKRWSPMDRSGGPLETAEGLVAVKSDQSAIVCVTRTGEIQVADLSQDAPLAAIQVPDATVTALTWMGSSIVSGDQTGRLNAWDGSTGGAVAEITLPSPAIDLAAAPDAT